MQLTQLLEQAGRASFADAALETAYHEERRERDVLRTRRVLLLMLLMLTGLGVIILVVSSRRQLPLPRIWVMLRFGVLIPAVLLSWFLAGRAWGKAHLQELLGFGLPVMVGAFALEWTAEWTPAMPLRALWLIPVLCLWALEMTLPMRPRAVVRATVGVFAITVTGIMAIVPGLDGLMIAAMLIAYAGCGYGLIWFARWRERDHREIFLHQRETQLLAEKLHAQNDTLAQLNQLRDEFITGVLHDLRSPLTSVFMATGLMQQAPDLPAADRARLLDEIMRSARRLDLFATHFLEQRSLENPAGKPVLTPVPLDQTVESVMTRARLQAGAKAQLLTIDTTTPHAVVMADELLLDRALSNLLDNAVKYSPHGAAITTRVSTDPDGRIRIAVSDTGPGLSPAEQARLFQPFTRFDKKTTGGEPSAGLGLSLVKQWAEAMGGETGCVSEEGRGATFWLALPQAA